MSTLVPDCGGVVLLRPAQAARRDDLRWGFDYPDGHRATTANGNDRWPDVLARRLQGTPATRTVIVLKIMGLVAISCCWMGWGQMRFRGLIRMCYGSDGVRYVIVFEGVNDLGTLTRRCAGFEPLEHKGALVERESASAPMSR